MRRYGLIGGYALAALSLAFASPSTPAALPGKMTRIAPPRRQWTGGRGQRYPFCGKRQRERYARNGMHFQQRNSHKPGTVQPRHIFG